MTAIQSQSGHGGHLRQLAKQAGRSPDQLLDFSANVNPLGFPEVVRPTVSRQIDRLAHYPDPEAQPLIEAIAAARGHDPACIIAGNGSMELLYAVARMLARGGQDFPASRRAVVLNPSFSGYVHAADSAGLSTHGVNLAAEDGFAPDVARIGGQIEPGDAVFLGQPNNPTGRLWQRDDLEALAKTHEKSWFVIDEAFADFVDEYASIVEAGLPNVIVIRSMTKFYALPGLRLGYAVVPRWIKPRLAVQIPCWSVNALAQAVGVAVLEDEAYAHRTREKVQTWRSWLRQDLGHISGMTVHEGHANFLLLHAASNMDDLPRRLLVDHGIAVRPCGNFPGLGPTYLRVAVRDEEANAQLVDALQRTLGGSSGLRRQRQKTPAIMFQGTSSYVGKSIMTAGLCRVLLQDGVDVAPFKAQNMSLNSFVTRDGGEIGRAQVVQAQACRLEPEVRMNPILLKPNSETGSQVMLNGRPLGNMRAAEYHRHKRELFGEVADAYDALAAEHDTMVIEGAGSAGEVNLKKHDIVNMRVADHADASVILVGDIDRGGVFASFIGTMEVMPEWERRLVAGYLINRFRGDPALLRTASDYTQLYTGRDVLGIVPFIESLGLPEEDSFGFRNHPEDDLPQKASACIDVAVVDVPRISNFTDCDALRLEPDVSVRIVRTPDDIGDCDVLILPGSKNTISDLRHLRETGMADAIIHKAAAGSVEIVGICGGLQMLGRRIADPHRTESELGVVDGLGLLDVQTTHLPDKTLRRVKAQHVESGLEVNGYEIHHGQTDLHAGTPVLRYMDGTAAGVRSEDGRVWGSYLHGVFDADPYRRWFINRVRQRKGWEALWNTGVTYDLEPALDHLAEVVREGLDMSRIYDLLER